MPAGRPPPSGRAAGTVSFMAATDVLKPDHAGSRRHFIFTEEHAQLRESIHNFVVKELRPHAE